MRGDGVTDGVRRTAQRGELHVAHKNLRKPKNFRKVKKKTRIGVSNLISFPRKVKKKSVMVRNLVSCMGYGLLLLDFHQHYHRHSVCRLTVNIRPTYM